MSTTTKATAMKLEDKEIAAVRQEAASLMERKGIPQAQIARYCGISSGTFSQFMAGKYPGDNSLLAQKVRGFLERESESIEKLFSFVYTTVAKRLISSYQVARATQKIVIASGDSGIGKTQAILRGISYKDPSALIIEADPGYNAREVFVELCEKLKISTTRNLNEMKRQVIMALKGSGRVIVIDEAEELPRRALELLRRVHDKAGCGILYVGMPKLSYQFRDKPDFKRLDNRIRMRVQLSAITAADVKALVAAHAPELEGFTDTLSKLCKGDARKLDNLMETVLQMADTNEEKVSEELIREAARALDEGR